MDATVNRRMPSKTTNQGKHTRAERADDLYPTPEPLTKALIHHIELPKRIWEPAAGMGHMSKVLWDAGHVVHPTDLVDYGRACIDVVVPKIDFFAQEHGPSGYDCIVTNPPFNCVDKFVRHGLTMVPTVWVLARLMFLEGARRSDLIDEKLSQVLAFVERPPMMHRWSQGPDGIWREWQGKKSTSAMPFAWFEFKRAKKSAPTSLKRIRWRPHA